MQMQSDNNEAKQRVPGIARQLNLDIAGLSAQLDAA